jgi:hypothetical protein
LKSGDKSKLETGLKPPGASSDLGNNLLLTKDEDLDRLWNNP